MNIKKIPEKPVNVPAEAIWNESDNEWELGENIDNKNKGVGNGGDQMVQ